MTDDTSDRDTTRQLARAAFAHYLQDNPSSHRVSQAERANLIDWLTNPFRRPSSQPEFSRRNYARKSFFYDGENDILFAVAKKDGDSNRRVVTEDMIVDIVETVHQDNGHAGWDATWKDCRTCAGDPRKRPKGSAASTFDSLWIADVGHDPSNVDGVPHEKQ